MAKSERLTSKQSLDIAALKQAIEYVRKGGIGDETNEIKFTDRFPKPDWYKPDSAQESK